MKLILSILHKAKTSPYYLWLLNRLLWRLIPFNHSHKVTIHAISDEAITIKLPYRKSNQNHLKGMHACALATLCEYACGIGLMTKLDPKKYRIILKEIKLDYQAQGKTDVFASFDIDAQELEDEILAPLASFGTIVRTYTVKAFDTNQKQICTGEITWQLKSWDKVKHA
jgi:acyl-coenzyme A thioesterase PaaI-like protein